MMRSLVLIATTLSVGLACLGGCNGAREASYRGLQNSFLDPNQVGRSDGGNPWESKVSGSMDYSAGGPLATGSLIGNGANALTISGGRVDAPGVYTPTAATAPAGGPVLTLAAAPVAEVAQQRMVIYNASLLLVVPDIAQTLATIQTQAKAAGGYMQEIAGGSITVRIPVAKFDEALSGFEKLGAVTRRNVKADDITEQMVDLKIRLENAEAMRVRLLALVEKSTKMEDTLKIEQELHRVTETIELIKGKIKFYSSQAAYSTIRVELNSPLPQQSQAVAAIPFAWVRSLADGAVAGVAEASPDTSRWERRGIKMTLPPSYIRYFERDYRTEAMSASGITVKLQRQDNYDGGDLAFWSKLATRTLTENRAISIEKEYDAKLDNGVAARVVVGVKDLGNRKTQYLLVLVAGKRYVYTYEAWGEQGEMKKDVSVLEAAAKTMDVGR